MPIIKSAIKRAKQSLTRRSRNLQVKRAIKQDVTALHQAIATGEGDVQAALAAAYSEIDRAVKKHTLHKNTAARRKSQLAAAVAKSGGETKAEAKPATTKGATKKPAAKTTGAKAAAKPATKKAPAKKTAE